MKKSVFLNSKRVLAFALSAIMMTSVLSGCDNSSEDPESTETYIVSGSEEAFSEAMYQPGAESENSLKLLHERISNGLITGVEALATEGKCIAADSAFRITASEDVSPEEIKSRISISP